MPPIRKGLQQHTALLGSLGGPLRLRSGWLCSTHARARIRLADPQAPSVPPSCAVCCYCRRRCLRMSRASSLRRRRGKRRVALRRLRWPRDAHSCASGSGDPAGKRRLETDVQCPAVSLLAPLPPPARSALRTHAARLGGGIGR